MTESLAIVIFGATGDLVERKIIPALNDLHSAGFLPANLKIIGVGRRPFSQAEFRRFLQDDRLVPLTSDLLTQVSYVGGLFDDPQTYQAIRAQLEELGCAKVIFYLAIPPTLYEVVARQLAASSLTKLSEQACWSRILVEKPFGSDLATANHLESVFADLFQEEQVYRIDHYLAKENSQNILAFRFGNSLFEHLWRREYIASLQIRLWEVLGVEERGGFYDQVGVLRDVGQNHLLQLVALVTMEPPASLEAETIRQQRAQLLTQLRITNHNQRGQYAGYLNIAGVQANSTTETYFQSIIEVDNERWRGVPIVIEAGKRLPEVKKEVVVNFRPAASPFCDDQSQCGLNSIVFSLEPIEAITLNVWVKKSGPGFILESRPLTLLVSDTSHHSLDPYTKLLGEAINGEQMHFVSAAEVRAAWQLIENIRTAWQKNNQPLKIYQPGSLIK